MTAHPSDLAALRALVEGASILVRACEAGAYTGRTSDATRAARDAIAPATAALARLEGVEEHNRQLFRALQESAGDGKLDVHTELALLKARLEGVTEEAIRSALNAALMLPARSPVIMNDEVLINMVRAVLALLKGVA